MMKVVSIRRGRAGTWDTLELINGMGVSGSTNPFLKRFTLGVALRQWNATLKQYWVFVEETEETLRSVNMQAQNLIAYQKLYGDCDDAAVIAVALATAANLPYRIVAMRAPEHSEFGHVFVEIRGPANTWIRVDPTAPVDADYNFWERMPFPQ